MFARYDIPRRPLVTGPVNSTSTQPVRHHVRELEITFSAECYTRYRQLDWDAIDTAMSTLPHLQRVVIGFFEQEHKDMWNQEGYSDRLWRLQQADKLCVGVWLSKGIVDKAELV